MTPTVSHHPNVEEDRTNDHLKKSFQRGYKGIIVVVDGEALFVFYSLRSVFFHFLQTCCNNDPRKNSHTNLPLLCQGANDWRDDEFIVRAFPYGKRQLYIRRKPLAFDGGRV